MRDLKILGLRRCCRLADLQSNRSGRGGHDPAAHDGVWLCLRSSRCLSPVAVWLTASLLFGLGGQLWLLWQENKSYKHSAQKQHRDQTVAESREQDARRGA